MDLDSHGKQFNLLGVAYREDGSVARRLGDTLKLDAGAPALYHYSHQFNLPPGRYRVRVTVGSGGEPFGSAEKTIEIAPWDGEMLSASGIALSVKDYALTGVTAGLDNSLLEGSRRLASKGRLIVPMGGAQLPTGQNGLFYFEVYEPRLTQATAKQPTQPPLIRIRILDGTTGEGRRIPGR